MTEALQDLAQKLGEALKKRDFKLVTAESCTGGGLSFWITSISGSSNWFDRGFVTYSDTSKIEMLGVNKTTIENFGAVSKEVVSEMAESALKKTKAHISCAITGIAGPTGGSTEKPVGTVWIALAKRGTTTQTEVDIFSGNRSEIREKTIEVALKKLLRLVEADGK